MDFPFSQTFIVFNDFVSIFLLFLISIIINCVFPCENSIHSYHVLGSNSPLYYSFLFPITPFKTVLVDFIILFFTHDCEALWFIHSHPSTHSLTVLRYNDQVFGKCPSTWFCLMFFSWSYWGPGSEDSKGTDCRHNSSLTIFTLTIWMRQCLSVNATVEYSFLLLSILYSLGVTVYNPPVSYGNLSFTSLRYKL